MLREISPVRQHQDELFRRWFEDEFFDLIVWYNQRQEIFGFQLCYQKSTDEHAMTWRQDGGYDHHRIDPGEHSVWDSKAPVLIAAGAFPRERIKEGFLKRSQAIDPEVVQYVVQKIEAYTQPTQGGIVDDRPR